MSKFVIDSNHCYASETGSETTMMSSMNHFRRRKQLLSLIYYESSPSSFEAIAQIIAIIASKQLNILIIGV